MAWDRKTGFGSGNATIPLARPAVFAWGLRLGPSAGVLNWFVPRIEFRYDEISKANAVVSSAARAGGVEFVAPKADIYAISWVGGDSGFILDLLEGRGVSVNRLPVRLTWHNWLSRIDQ